MRVKDSGIMLRRPHNKEEQFCVQVLMQLRLEGFEMF